MNVTRQPLLIALPTLLLLLGALLVRKEGLSFAPEALCAPQTLLQGWLQEVQTAWPRTAQALWFVLTSASALTLGRLGLRYKLYARNNLLPISLYGLVAWGLLFSDDLLCGSLCALLLCRVLRNYCSSYRNGYSFTSTFRGSLYLGMIPLLYAPALPLMLLILLCPLLFRRTLREWIVALTGLLFPLFALCYLHWALTEDLLSPAVAIWQGMLTPSGFSLFSGRSIILAIQLVVILAATLWALFYFLADRYAATTKVRSILTLQAWLLFLGIAMLFLPGTTANLLPLLAVPISLLLPLLFLKLPPRWANLLYALLWLLTLLHLLW